jgi:hypothetical protein
MECALPDAGWVRSRAPTCTSPIATFSGLRLSLSCSITAHGHRCPHHQLSSASGWYLGRRADQIHERRHQRIAPTAAPSVPPVEPPHYWASPFLSAHLFQPPRLLGSLPRSYSLVCHCLIAGVGVGAAVCAALSASRSSLVLAAVTSPVSHAALRANSQAPRGSQGGGCTAASAVDKNENIA